MWAQIYPYPSEKSFLLRVRKVVKVSGEGKMKERKQRLSVVALNGLSQQEPWDVWLPHQTYSSGIGKKLMTSHIKVNELSILALVHSFKGGNNDLNLKPPDFLGYGGRGYQNRNHVLQEAHQMASHDLLIAGLDFYSHILCLMCLKLTPSHQQSSNTLL